MNGSEVLQSRQPGADAHCVIVSLKRGRNAILARVDNLRGDHFLNLRLSLADGDFARAYFEAKKWPEASDAYSRAMARAPDTIEPRVHELMGESLAGRQRWKEATAVFETLASDDPANINRQYDLLRCYLALKDHKGVQRICQAEITRHGKSGDRALANVAIWHAALLPDAVSSYAEVLEIARKLNNTRNPAPNECNTFGALLYRAGHYSSSLALLKMSIDGKHGKGDAFDWVFTAMARHKSNLPGDREALARARELTKESATTWQLRVELNTLIEEAEHQLKLPPRK